METATHSKPLSTTLDDERVVPGLSDNATYQSHLARYHFALRWIQPADRVLETACGVGYGAQMISRNTGLLIGADYSSLALRHAKAHYPAANLHLAQIDCHRLALADAAFDVVISFEVFEHLEDAEGYLSECCRVLRPGGRLLLSTPNRPAWNLHMQSIGQDYEFHINMMNLGELRACLQQHFPRVQMYGQRRRGNWLYTNLRKLDVLNLRLRLFPPARREQLQQKMGVRVGADLQAEEWVFSPRQLRQSNHFFAVCEKGREPAES